MSLTNHVQYECACGNSASLAELYFCRYDCMKLRCKLCVAHEVDSLQCSQCHELVPSIEARSQQHACKRCQLCPRCNNILAIRGSRSATGETATEDTCASGDSLLGGTKMHHLACNVCRWSSRLGDMDEFVDPQSLLTLPREPVNQGDKAKIENAFLYYKAVGEIERRSELERTSNYERYVQNQKRRSTMGVPYYSERAGIPQMLKLKGLNPNGTLNRMDKLNEDYGLPVEATNDDLEDEMLTELLDEKWADLKSVTTLSERLAAPYNQTMDPRGQRPLHRVLTVTESYRCRSCMHQVCRLYPNASKVKFRIQNFAMLYVPDVRVRAMSPIPAEKDTPFAIRLQIVSLLENDTQVILLPNGESVDDPSCIRVRLPDNPIKISRRPLAGDVNVNAASESDDIEFRLLGEKNKLDKDEVGLEYTRFHKVIVLVEGTLKETPKPDEPLFISLLLKYEYTHSASSTALHQQQSTAAGATPTEKSPPETPTVKREWLSNKVMVCIRRGGKE